MDDLLTTILSRRSIRRYNGETVKEAEVEGLLRAAMAAPSAHNEQPWHFVVIRNRETLTAITAFHQYSAMLAEADLAILVCGDMKEIKAGGFWVQDCAAATENILLAAHGLGLGGVWLGVYPHDSYVHELSRLLQLPAHVVPFALISLGRPAEIKKAADRYDPQRVHLDRWTAADPD